jgi:hypothetical protein
MYGEQQLLINHAYIFAIPMFEKTKGHEARIER